MENGKAIVYTSSYYDYHPDRIQFTETDEKKGNTTLFVLEKVNDQTTRLYHIAIKIYITPGNLLFIQLFTKNMAG